MILLRRASVSLFIILVDPKVSIGVAVSQKESFMSNKTFLILGGYEGKNEMARIH